MFAQCAVYVDFLKGPLGALKDKAGKACWYQLKSTLYECKYRLLKRKRLFCHIQSLFSGRVAGLIMLPRRFRYH